MRMRQKRPVYAAKEAYLCGQRGLFMQQKTPIYAVKEACLCGKRGLLTLAYPGHATAICPLYYCMSLLLYVFTTVCRM